MSLLDKTYFLEKQFINRYLLKQLNHDDLNHFEIFILENPEIIQEIQQECGLYRAFKQNQILLSKKININKNFIVKCTAIAASLVIGLSFSLFPAKQEVISLQTPILLQAFRSNSFQRLSARGFPTIQLKIDVGPIEIIGESTFSINVVQIPDEKVVTTTSGLIVGSDGWLNYSLLSQSTPLLGEYEVRVTSEESSITNVTYLINFTE